VSLLDFRAPLHLEQQMVFKDTAISNNTDAITAETLARTTADGL
jgi:hypothetical protein